MSKELKFEELIAVSGLPGLYKMVANRSNGLIVESLLDGKRRFCSIRKHQFTPMAGVSIYTVTDATPMDEVMKALYNTDQSEEHNVSDQDSAEAQKELFGVAVPDYDPDQVSGGDIKKVIKWYCFLRDNELIDFTQLAVEEEE